MPYLLLIFLLFLSRSLLAHEGGQPLSRAQRELNTRLDNGIKDRAAWLFARDELLSFVWQGARINTQRGNNSLLSLAVRYNDHLIASKLLTSGAQTDIQMCAVDNKRHCCDEKEHHSRKTLYYDVTSSRMAHLLYTYKTPYTHEADTFNTPLAIAVQNPAIPSALVLFYLKNFRENTFRPLEKPFVVEQQGQYNAILKIFLAAHRYTKNQEDKDLFRLKLGYLTDVDYLVQPNPSEVELLHGQLLKLKNLWHPVEGKETIALYDQTIQYVEKAKEKIEKLLC